jgi:hypothetical protein
MTLVDPYDVANANVTVAARLPNDEYGRLQVHVAELVT